MSFYNIVQGYNASCFYFLPMLGRKDYEYPRFRDCFLSDDGQRIVIYTRVGGGNRNSGFHEEELYKDPNFVTTYDDAFDSTYGSYEFNVPDKWRSDFEKIKRVDLESVSDEYVNYVKKFYPELAAKGKVDRWFRREIEPELVEEAD